MFRIGNFTIDNRTILAPMAGVTDLPFRQLCRRFGAGLAVSEMVTADTRLWDSRKSRNRLPHLEEAAPRMVQIAGGDPAMLADAARQNVALGAQIIDINMGCPAKKVCRKAAGSALLQDEGLVAEILAAVVAAVAVPVTLKIRTGWNPDNRNALAIARIAEDAGIQALAIHGRTRACKFAGHAEYDTIAAVAQSVAIPVFANGDITSPAEARRVLDHTGAAAVMIGRAAQGSPWIFREINHYLATGALLPPPTRQEVRATLRDHLIELHRFYGPVMGPRIARKHAGWYLETLPGSSDFRRHFNGLEGGDSQLAALDRFFDTPFANTEQRQDRAA
ncbi:MAG TPA: tRNA dihydrouridine synthase DusB [Porticoccaceae bacterium]|nr:tRNA dihydrouridine synthase DusB [Porticoccaceae bacterium]